MYKGKTEDPRTVRELINSSAEKFGGKTFIKFFRGGREYEKSYDDVRHDSFAVCRYIRSVTDKRCHIAVIGKTNYEYITVVTGVLLSGNVVVPLAPGMNDEDTAALLEHSDADMLFTDASSAVAEKCRRVKHIVNLGDIAAFEEIYNTYDENGNYAALSDFPDNPDECALIMYTSGTTGDKKGVMLTNHALVSNTCFKELSFTPGDVTLSVLPMHHIFCFSSDYLKNIKDGVTVCLNGDVRNIAASLQRYEPTIIRLVPAMIVSLHRQIKLIMSRNPDLSPRKAAESVFGRRLRWITSSSAYLNPEVIKDLENMGIKVRQAYGMTEAGPRISVPDAETSVDSVGRIISSCEVRTVFGEIQVKSDSIMLGYYKDARATAAAITSDGWLRTGDIGHVSETGELYITGRLKNLIILSNGENVSPESIEKRYADEPLIKEILVFEKNDKIAARVYPDLAYAHAHSMDDVESEVEKIIFRVNSESESTHEINIVEISLEPLRRTDSGKLVRVERAV